LAALPTVGASSASGREPLRPPENAFAETGHEIQDLIDLARRNNLAELEIERDGVRIRIRRDAVAGGQAGPVREVLTGGQDVQEEMPAPVGPAEAAGYVTVTSPIVGTFYRAASPDADPYVEEGDFIKKGQVLCIVEAMKLMNEIEAETDGRIIKILAESTKPVEYGQPLFLIDPNPAS
jgi:acetyl-CoA carboxylase biotin carboxyl carrier protein